MKLHYHNNSANAVGIHTIDAVAVVELLDRSSGLTTYTAYVMCDSDCPMMVMINSTFLNKPAALSNTFCISRILPAFIFGWGGGCSTSYSQSGGGLVGGVIGGDAGV